MIRASIDIGSNSTLLLIAEVSDEGILREVANESRVTGLGKGLASTGEFAQEPMKETYIAIKEYVELANDVGVDSKDIIVTATEASRVAKNAQEFYSRIIAKLGIKVRVISGEGEAYYTACGVCKMAKATGDVTIVDIGGASTELMKVRSKPFKVIDSISLPIGSVRATDWNTQGKLLNELRTAWAGTGADSFATESAIFVAGTMTSLGAMIMGMTSFQGEKLDGQKIDFQKLDIFIKKIEQVDAESLREQYPFLGKRASSIIGGAQVALFLGEKMMIKKLQISPYGLRYGTLLEGNVEDRYVQRLYE